MSSLTFPDVNLWLALTYENHVHRTAALTWWISGATGRIGFTRFTQMGLLRLITTAAVMNDKPLTMAEAWQTYDRLFDDGRVTFIPEPADVEIQFRRLAAAPTVSPKVWADAYLLAFAYWHQGQVVTFDRALRNRGVDCLVLA